MTENDASAKGGQQTEGAAPAGPVPDAFWADMDPDGWMSERPRYWLDLRHPEPPSRAAWLRHRCREAAAYLRSRHEDPWTQPRTPEEEWIRLSEQALGRLPRPEKPEGQKQAQARSAPPNPPRPARKPKAYSPKATGV